MWPFSKKKSSSELTLKKRVGEFWDWYANHAARFYATIENKKCGDLTTEVCEAVDRWLPSMAWVFGAGEGHLGHSFTLTGEGVIERQFVSQYWLSRAPKLDGWTFYASRQPGDDVRDFGLRFGNGQEFYPEELWVHPVVNEKSEMLDVSVWHPLFSSIPENARWRTLFLLLDEVLGEFGTQNWIGQIEFSDAQLKQSVPIWELPEVITQTTARQGWKKGKPTDTYTSYEVKRPHSGERGDIIVGSTRNWNLTRDFISEAGPVDHPLPDIGLEFAYLAFDKNILPQGEEVDARSQIEDSIEEVLSASASGHTLGGATGRHRAYIDFMTFDGVDSMELVRQVLRKRNLPKGSEIRYFTKNLATKVIRL